MPDHRRILKHKVAVMASRTATCGPMPPFEGWFRGHLGAIAVMDRCATGDAAFQSYRHLHHLYPEREFYFVHTSREELEIYERHWVGIRRDDAAPVTR